MIEEIEKVRRAIASLCDHGRINPDVDGPHNHHRTAGHIVANALSSLDRIESLIRSIQDFEARWGRIHSGIIEQDIQTFDFDIDQYRESIGGPTELKETQSKDDLLQQAIDISNYKP